MIISRTPFRISFTGGGTDLKAFYSREPGLVVSTTINKYMYITVHESFDRAVRVSYSKTEIVEEAAQLRHPIVRAAMELTGVTRGVEITSVADVPAGTGLGSSSSFTVGLLNALYAYQGRHVSSERLAEEASRIEIEMVGEPIGKQDQYAAAFGGLQSVTFQPDESVAVQPMICSAEVKQAFESRLLLFYSGQTREAKTILTAQREKTAEADGFASLRAMKALSERMRTLLQVNRPDALDDLGRLLHEGWELKKGMAQGISNEPIDRHYHAARQAGALGGKLLGAGGGGFLLFYVPQASQAAVREALPLREIPFRFESQGSRIIFVSD